MNFFEKNYIYVNDPFDGDGAAEAPAEGPVLVYSSHQTTGLSLQIQFKVSENTG